MHLFVKYLKVIKLVNYEELNVLLLKNLFIYSFNIIIYRTSHDVVLLYTSRREYTILTTTTTPTPTTSTTTVASAPLKLCYPQISITWKW